MAVNSLKRVGTTQLVLSLTDTPVIAFDQFGTIVEINPCACTLFGYSQEQLLNQNITLLLPPHVRPLYGDFMEKFLNNEGNRIRMAANSTLLGYRQDGSSFPIEATLVKKQLQSDWLLVLSLRDITEMQRSEQERQWHATHDSLTGLANRSLIQDRLNNALLRSSCHGKDVVLLFLDIDSFKLINDTHGYSAGNYILKTIASRLHAEIRPGDTVARVAGDEFIVLCENLHNEHIRSVVERLSNRLREPFNYNDSPLFITASIGVATGDNQYESSDEFLNAADTAMHAVKTKGGDGWQFLDEQLQAEARKRLMTTNGLRLAIDRDELSPRFQPIVDTQSECIVGAELLLRWHSPQGEISPAYFIPIAEMTGMITRIGHWVFEQGCKAEARWRELWQDKAPYISINVSARQLSERTLADDFAKVLHDTGADPSRIQIEITETSLMTDVETSTFVLHQLNELGIRVAVDDFGTGYSSLAQLTHMPVNVLKIDKAFVDGIEGQQENRTLICAVIGLGRTLNIKLLAEGVENLDQLQELREYGCDLIQGYYFHKPLLEDEFIHVVNQSLLKAQDQASR